MQLKQRAKRQDRLVRGKLVEKNWWTRLALNVEKIISINSLLEGHASITIKNGRVKKRLNENGDLEIEKRFRASNQLTLAK